jgi:diguanylate cyclase (GGDEF)-like protein/PAS domain S-box-containing protein
MPNALNADVLAAADGRLNPAPAPTPGPNWLAVLSLGLLVLATTWFSITYTRFQTGVSAVWLSNGLLCGALLLVPRAHWRWYFLLAAAGQVMARLIRQDPWHVIGALLFANMIECAVVAFWVRRREGDLDRARSLPRVSRAALGSTLLACALSGVIVAPILAMRTSSPPMYAWLTWYGAHVLGLVIVATLVVCAFQRHVRMVPEGALERVDYAACLTLLLIACWVVFTQERFPVLFLVFLPLLLLAWRHGLSGMVVGVVVLACTSGLPATKGQGPFGLVSSTDPTVRLLFWQMYIASACVLAYSSAVSLARRRQLENSLLRSESRYRLLAENSKDMIVRRRESGDRAYVSPASLALTGYAPEDLPPLDVVVHPDDRGPLKSLFARLFSGEATEGTIRYRVFHRDGHVVWLEALARRVVDGGEAQVVYVARDISARVQAEQGQAAAQAQLLAITQHLPAMVARFDREGRYLYANERSMEMFGERELVGKSLRELRGEERYAALLPHIHAVLQGESPAFDGWLDTPAGRVELRVQFVPDRAPDGSVQGFYSLSFDITERVNFQRELERLARADVLTGLANRRRFEEELEAAVARAVRTGTALMVIALDLDKFKQINDTFGHAAGDEVLVEFGRRIRASVYNVDLVARLGGDEFVVLVQYTATAEAGERIARQILASMQPPMALSVGPVQAATSIGVGIQQPVVSAAALVALADRALYEAKSRGRNTYSLLRE